MVKVTDMQSGSQSEPFDVEMGDRLEDMIRDLWTGVFPNLNRLM